MIDLEFLQSLIRALDESSLDSVEIERAGTRIRLAKTPDGFAVSPAAPVPVPLAPPGAPHPHVHPLPPAPAPAPGEPAGAVGEAAGGEAAPAAAANLVEVRSPMVGTFYRSPSPDADPFVSVGDTVSPGDTLCIIEAMKLMNELESEVSGVVREILVDNADPVEYGQLLFRVEPR